MLDYRICPSCNDVHEHVRDGEQWRCTVCGVVGESEPTGDCRFDDCAEDATHYVVWNPVQGDRQVEEYCEGHAEVAAEDAKNDTAGDLFYGPAPIED